jgi:hypothetical protein
MLQSQANQRRIWSQQIKKKPEVPPLNKPQNVKEVK